MNILIAGDFCPKNRIANIISTTNRDDILHNVAPIIRNCDLSVVNLECPIVNTNAEPIIKEGPQMDRRRRTKLVNSFHSFYK